MKCMAGRPTLSKNTLFLTVTLSLMLVYNILKKKDCQNRGYLLV